MNSAKHDVITMHAKFAVTRERVHKLKLVRKIAAFHRLDQMDHF